MSSIDPNADFDWFAIDASGDLALFATGGAGFLPPAVIEYHVMHETVAGGIEYPSWGTDAVWKDVAALGLFVYDWSTDHGGYRQVARPEPNADVAFTEMIRRISDLPELVGVFNITEQISDVNAFRITD